MELQWRKPTPKRKRGRIAGKNYGLSRKGIDIELGLAALMKHRDPHKELTQTDIAYVCGCTKSAIQHIEYQAIKKLREKGLTPVIMEWRNER